MHTLSQARRRVAKGYPLGSHQVIKGVILLFFTERADCASGFGLFLYLARIPQQKTIPILSANLDLLNHRGR